MNRPRLDLILIQGRFAVCRLPPNAELPSWAAGEFSSLTRTSDELSVVCAEDAVPKDIRCEAGWRILKVAGPLDFGLTGILLSIAGPLAEAGISIFALATYDTDYVMVKEQNLDRAIRALETAGHRVTPRRV